MSDFKGLAHIGLFTESIEKSTDFYVKSLGFKLEYETKVEKPNNAWLRIAFINLNGMVIELLEPSDKSALKTGNAGSVDHLTIEVKNLDSMLDPLRAAGIVFETEQPIKMDKLFNGCQVIFFRGPSGERLELFEFLG